jgi:hypothetical protein
VDKHIAYIAEVSPATSRDLPRLAATAVAGENKDDSEQRPVTTSPDLSRPVATGSDSDARYVIRLEGEVEFLRGQVTTKDGQIKELTERSRETNHLIAGLQQMLSPLLGAPRRPQQGSDGADGSERHT